MRAAVTAAVRRARAAARAARAYACSGTAGGEVEMRAAWPPCPGVGTDTTRDAPRMRVEGARRSAAPLAPGEVEVHVHAAGVNRLDLLQRAGRYPVPAGASDILGVEAAGTVARTAGSLSVGTPVAALLDGGGYAEFVRVPAAQCIDLRAVTGGSGEHARALTWAEAGAVPEAWCAAHQLLRWVGQVRQGDTVLVHAGASGVGTAAVQLARGAGAARVVATASSAERRRACVELGATHVAPSRGLDDSRGDAYRELLDAVGRRGADVILDCVGAAASSANSAALAKDGRWVVYGFMGGAGKGASPASELIGGALLAKRASILFSTLRSRDAGYKARLVREVAAHICPRLADGEYQAVVDSVFSLSEEGLNGAHAHLRGGNVVGKIVLAAQAATQVQADALAREHVLD